VVKLYIFVFPKESFITVGSLCESVDGPAETKKSVFENALCKAKQKVSLSWGKQN
jgi:hypothetical protein